MYQMHCSMQIREMHQQIFTLNTEDEVSLYDIETHLKGPSIFLQYQKILGL